MHNAIKAGGVYFAVVFALGFALGVFRTLVLLPLTGELAAVALELPVMLAASWIACGWAIRRFEVFPELPVRAVMGATAFLLLMAAETLVSTLVAGRNISEHLALYQTLPVLLGFCAQLLFAAFPLIRHR